MHEFDKLSDRKRYGANRRADLLSKLLKDKKDIVWMYSYEVDVEKYLKRKLGYSEWDTNWDVGLHLKGGEVYLMLSKKNKLGSFQELEKVKYSKDLNAATWISDCLVMHKAHLERW